MYNNKGEQHVSCKSKTVPNTYFIVEVMINAYVQTGRLVNPVHVSLEGRTVAVPLPVSVCYEEVCVDHLVEESFD